MSNDSTITPPRATLGKSTGRTQSTPRKIADGPKFTPTQEAFRVALKPALAVAHTMLTAAAEIKQSGSNVSRLCWHGAVTAQRALELLDAEDPTLCDAEIYDLEALVAGALGAAVGSPSEAAILRDLEPMAVHMSTIMGSYAEGQPLDEAAVASLAIEVERVQAAPDAGIQASEGGDWVPFMKEIFRQTAAIVEMMQREHNTDGLEPHALSALLPRLEVLANLGLSAADEDEPIAELEYRLHGPMFAILSKEHHNG